MAVKIRLTRTGRKKLPSYRVVVADSRMPRDGRFLDIIGHYDPKTEPSVVEIDHDKANKWLGQGAQPTLAAKRLLEISGVLPESERSKQRKANKKAAPKKTKAKAKKAEAPAETPVEAPAEAPTEEPKVEEAPVEEAPAAETPEAPETPEAEKTEE